MTSKKVCLCPWCVCFFSEKSGGGGGQERIRKENKDNAVLTTPDRKMIVLLSCETVGGRGGRGGHKPVVSALAPLG